MPSTGSSLAPFLLASLLSGLLVSMGSACGQHISGPGDDTGIDDSSTSLGGILTVDFVLPTSGAWYSDVEPLAVQVSVTDPAGDSVDGIDLSWSGDAASAAVLPDATQADGSAIFDIIGLSPGVHGLSVQALRADGAMGFATTAFQVVTTDADFDGYNATAFGGDDCDDTDPTIHPGAEEYCDGRDNDCNGVKDGADAVDVSTWYLDLDADGYGVTELTTQVCQQPKDYVLLPGDCNDANDTIHPGAVEVCDGVDNDCDDLTDDADPDLQTATAFAWYPDTDADGYGDWSGFTLACIAPVGFIAIGGDCDDGDPAINPGAVEYCDGLDNNCADGVDEEGAVDAATWYRDGDGDYYGLDDETTASCEEPTGYTALPGDCNDGDARVNPGAQELCNDSLDGNCDGEWTRCLGDLPSEPARLLGEDTLDEAAYSFQDVGDMDGDGTDDLLVGARSATGDSASGAGRAYLVLGPLSGEVSLSSADTILEGSQTDGHAGRRVAGGLDADGDDIPDLAVSAPSAGPWGGGVGTVYLVSGADALDGGTQSLSDALHRFTGEENYSYLGVGLDQVDLDEDGVADLLLGAPSLDTGATNAGAVYLFYGPFHAGSTDLRDATWDARLLGTAIGDQVGSVIKGEADVDGDGNRDVVLGAPNLNAGGDAPGGLVILLSAPSGEVDLADADVILTGDADGDQFGTSVATVGDADGDGIDDLLVGAPGADDLGSGAGEVLLLGGSHSLASESGSAASTLAIATIQGASTGDQAGASVAGGGDHDGDGIDDYLVGAPYGGPSAAGAAMLFRGPLSGSLTTDDADATWAGDTTTGGVGAGVSFGGNFAGMPTDAILVGARDADLSGTDAGALLVVAETGL